MSTSPANSGDSERSIGGDAPPPGEGAARRTDSAASGSTTAVSSSDSATGPSTPDEVFDALSNRRRRYALHYLGGHAGESVEVSSLSKQVAAWENDKPVDSLDRPERKRVHTALQQFHLPKLDDGGFVDYDAERGRVELAAATGLDAYVEVAAERRLPWGPHYAALSGAGAVVLLGHWAGALPVDVVPVEGWLAPIVAVMVLSALVQTWYGRRTRLGAGDEPPELRS